MLASTTASCIPEHLTMTPANLTSRHLPRKQPLPEPQANITQPEHEPSTTDTTSNLSPPKTYSLALPKTPYPKIVEPLSHRISFFLKIWLFKILGSLWLKYQHTFHPQPPHTNPDLTKTYPCRPNLPVQIFFPPNYKPTNSEQHPPLTSSDEKTTRTLYPLYISLHGGGLCLGSPTQDNTFNRTWSTKTNMLVASPSYTKTPLHPFPCAINDISTIITSLLTDPTLPIDHTKVILSGFSAGGLLSLSVSQLPHLLSKISAVVAYYPCVDFSEYPHDKFTRRLDTSREKENLHFLGGALDWGYVNPRTDRRDRLLSPCYAERWQLPRNVCVVGVQYDMFCREARDMVFRLAGKECVEEGDGWMDGFEEVVVVGRGKEGKEEEEKYTAKWVYMPGMPHGFTEVIGRPLGEKGDQLQNLCEGLYEDVHQWLKKNAL